MEPPNNKKSKSRASSVDSQNLFKKPKSDGNGKGTPPKQANETSQKSNPKRSVSFAIQAMTSRKGDRTTQQNTAPKPKLNQVLSAAFGEMKSSTLQKRSTFSFSLGTQVNNPGSKYTPKQVTQSGPASTLTLSTVKETSSQKPSLELPQIKETKPEPVAQKQPSNYLVPALPPLAGNMQSRSHVDLTEFMEDQGHTQDHIQANRSMSLSLEKQSALLDGLLDKPADRRDTCPAVLTSFHPSDSVYHCGRVEKLMYRCFLF